jgi:very-short-patch-repair endonuclease
VKISADLRHKILITELKKVLLQLDGQSMAEVPFSHIMPTKRKFRADFFCPNRKTIIEVNGGQFNSGRHTRGGTGYQNDLFKINLAQYHGFKVYQFTYEMLEKRVHHKFLKP